MNDLLKDAVNKTFPCLDDLRLPDLERDITEIGHIIKTLQEQDRNAPDAVKRNPTRVTADRTGFIIMGPGERFPQNGPSKDMRIAYAIQGPRGMDGNYPVTITRSNAKPGSPEKEKNTERDVPKSLRILYTDIIKDIKEALPFRYHDALATQLRTGTTTAPSSAPQLEC